MNKHNRYNYREGIRKYINLNNIYLNVDLITHHEAVERNPRHSRVTFDAQVDGKPLVLEVDLTQKELTSMIENAEEYDWNRAPIK
jgi:hypothetical protein